MTGSIAIIGAGIVGMTTALELARRGFRVTLFDPDTPGSRTSTWNAGVFATSSLVPLSNPGIYPKLAGLALGRNPGFSARTAVLAGQARWITRFLAASRRSVFDPKVAALNGLIGLSRGCHLDLMKQAGCLDLLHQQGWLHLYRTDKALAVAKASLALYARFAVKAEAVDGAHVADMEPGLQHSYAGALHFPDTAAVIDPALLMRAYGRLLEQAGVPVRRFAVTRLAKDGTRYVLTTPDGPVQADQVVVCAGAWSNDVLGTLGRLPLIVERGYLQKYRTEGAVLSQPVFDTACGIVLSPRPEGVQLSTGTDLTTITAPPRLCQFHLAERNARAILKLEEPLMTGPQIGNRPTLPDGLPAIGPIRRHPGLWIAAGHQHVGFSTGPGTARLLADQITGAVPAMNMAPFLPSRFGL